MINGCLNCIDMGALLIHFGQVPCIAFAVTQSLALKAPFIMLLLMYPTIKGFLVDWHRGASSDGLSYFKTLHLREYKRNPSSYPNVHILL